MPFSLSFPGHPPALRAAPELWGADMGAAVGIPRLCVMESPGPVQNRGAERLAQRGRHGTRAHLQSPSVLPSHICENQRSRQGPDSLGCSSSSLNALLFQ